MKIYSAIVAQKWEISADLAADICRYFEEGYALPYVCDYAPAIVAELDSSQVADIYRFLSNVASLAPKRKRTLSALKKADALTQTVENRIMLSTSATELDDLILPYRPNPRSKGQQALKLGIEPLANLVHKQEEEQGTLEEHAEKYVGTNSKLKTVDDVIQAVKDVLIERFAYDETVRSMVRDFGYDDGFFEVVPRTKKDRQFAQYRGKYLPITEMSAEEKLKLLWAEEQKQIRLKHGVQLFTITELLREHFIENPDAIGFELIMEAIDECWNRLLQPMVEKDIKERIREEAENWALHQITGSLDTFLDQDRPTGPCVAMGMFEGNDLVIVGCDAGGQLLGATRERVKPQQVSSFTSTRLKQFQTRYRATRVIVVDNDFADTAFEIAQRSLDDSIELARQESKADMAKSEWMQERFADLDDAMRVVYAAGLRYLHPPLIMPQIGLHYFSIHPLQKFVGEERMGELVEGKIAELALHQGVPYLEAPNSALRHLSGVTDELLAEIRRHGGRTPLNAKSELRSVKGVTEVVFQNIAGYIIIPNSAGPLDRTLVHPDHFEWVGNMADELSISLETLVTEPEQLRSATVEDAALKTFSEKKLIFQLQAGQRYAGAATQRVQRRLRLNELEEGAIVSGKVTNITPFGVFVDINAVCDGLVHISQLADGYVEHPDQVVHVNDKVDVRILSIDTKKRRISLSMRNLGTLSKRISPTKAQLNGLAEHFKK